MGYRTCEKPKVNYKKGLWSPEEDQRLRGYILKHGQGCWSAVPIKAGLQRNGKSCRLRWINYLRPGLKRGMFSQEEEEIVMNLHAMLGNKWSQIATHLPGRTDNEVKNYYNSYLKKRVVKLDGADSLSPSNQYQESNSQSPKRKQPSKELKNKSQCFELPEPVELSSVDSGRSILPGIGCSSSKVTPQNPFPKILFADWLSNDHLSGQGLDSQDGSVSCHLGSDSNIEAFKSVPSLVDAEPTGDFPQSFGDDSCFRGFHTEFQPSVQIQGGDFFDLLSIGELCGNFETNHDVFF